MDRIASTLNEEPAGSHTTTEGCQRNAPETFGFVTGATIATHHQTRFVGETHVDVTFVSRAKDRDIWRAFAKIPLQLYAKTTRTPSCQNKRHHTKHVIDRSLKRLLINTST